MAGKEQQLRKGGWGCEGLALQVVYLGAAVGVLASWRTEYAIWAAGACNLGGGSLMAALAMREGRLGTSPSVLTSMRAGVLGAPWPRGEAVRAEC